MAILELFKIVMYKFHYNYMLNKFSPQDMKRCYMDTDNYVFEIRRRMCMTP